MANENKTAAEPTQAELNELLRIRQPVDLHYDPTALVFELDVAGERQRGAEIAVGVADRAGGAGGPQFDRQRPAQHRAGADPLRREGLEGAAPVSPDDHRRLRRAELTVIDNVRPTLEVVITETPRHLHRRKDEATGLSLIRL